MKDLKRLIIGKESYGLLKLDSPENFYINSETPKNPIPFKCIEMRQFNTPSENPSEQDKTFYVFTYNCLHLEDGYYGLTKYPLEKATVIPGMVGTVDGKSVVDSYKVILEQI